MVGSCTRTGVSRRDSTIVVNCEKLVTFTAVFRASHWVSLIDRNDFETRWICFVRSNTTKLSKLMMMMMRRIRSMRSVKTKRITSKNYFEPKSRLTVIAQLTRTVTLRMKFRNSKSRNALQKNGKQFLISKLNGHYGTQGVTQDRSTQKDPKSLVEKERLQNCDWKSKQFGGMISGEDDGRWSVHEVCAVGTVERAPAEPLCYFAN